MDRKIITLVGLTSKTNLKKKKQIAGASLLVQWLRLNTPKCREPGFDPCSGNYILHAAMKTEDPDCHN